MNAKADIRLGWYWGYQNVWGSYVAQPYSGDNTPIVEARRSPSCSTVIGAFEAATLEEAEAHIKAMVTKVGVDHGKYPPKAQPIESPVKPSKIIPYPMSKDALEILSAEQSERIQRIRDYHKQFADAAKATATMAMLCGFELTVLKEITPHGQFTNLRNRYFPEVSDRTAQRYMGLIGHARQIRHVSDLLTEAIAAPQKLLPAPSSDQLEKVFHDLSDGKTVTDLYRGAGVIREKEQPKHTPVKLTPEEKLQADLATAEAAVQDVRSAIAILRECDEAKDRESMLAKVKPDSRRALLAEALWLTKRLRKFNKGRKPRK